MDRDVSPPSVETSKSREPDREFLLLEYESLRQEQIAKIQETFTLTRFALITHGAIWAWLATNRDVPSFDLVVWFPVVLAGLFAGLYWALRRDVGVIGSKLLRLEVHFSVPTDLAWESDVSETYTRTQAIHWVVWLSLVLVNAVVAAVLGALA